MLIRITVTTSDSGITYTMVTTVYNIDADHWLNELAKGTYTEIKLEQDGSMETSWEIVE